MEHPIRPLEHPGPLYHSYWPMPASILPQPWIRVYFEHELPWGCPLPSHNANHNQNRIQQLKQCYKTSQSPKNDPSELPRTFKTPQTGIKRVKKIGFWHLAVTTPKCLVAADCSLTCSTTTSRKPLVAETQARTASLRLSALSCHDKA